MTKSYTYGLVSQDEIMARTGLEFLSDMAAGKLPQPPMCQTLGELKTAVNTKELVDSKILAAALAKVGRISGVR
jgi:hypothetical protein